MTDRVKESLFSVLGHRLGTPGAIPAVAVLDAFAGTGALGIEALSRGASSCVFVEHEARALRVLRENLAALELTGRARVVRENAWTMRVPEPVHAMGYGLIFVDPPYRDVGDAGRVRGLLERLSAVLEPAGVMVWRQSARGPGLRVEVPGLACSWERTFGGMYVALLEKPITDRGAGE